MMLRTVSLLSLSCLISLSAMADPSSRVAQLSSLQGAVTLIHPSSGEAQLASLNWPITGDNELVTDNFSRAEIRLGTTAIRLGSNTDLTIMQLDDNQLRLRLNRGSLQLNVRNVRDVHDVRRANELTIDIPQGRIGFSEPTNVRIDTRDDNDVSAINVISGTPYFDDGISRLAIAAGRRAEVDRSGLRVMESRHNFRRDSFDVWIAERDRQDELAGTPRYVSSDITGYQALNNYGTWRTTTTYGTIWSPTVVPAGWAPYRDGRWLWVAPWGWTWVDNAPWGYAPSHYGRWVYYEQRWCWTPGVFNARPVWAPALVGWVGGDGSGFGNDYFGNNYYSNNIYGTDRYRNRDGSAIGWFPLAPREIFVPAYQATPQYLQQINNGYSLGNSASYPGYGSADPRTTPYQNQLIRNATTVLPSYQFGNSKTVIVTPSLQRGERLQPVRKESPVATAPSFIGAPIGRLSSAATTSPSPIFPAAPASVQVQTATEPIRLSDPRTVSIAASPIMRSPSGESAINPRQTPSPTLSTIVVRPLQSLPQRQLPTATLAVPGPTTQPGARGMPSAPLQKKEEVNKLSTDQQNRSRPSNNGINDNATARDGFGFGRGSLQR